MAIKDLFRKRSKSRVRSSGSGYDVSRPTTPTPGAALASAGSSPITQQQNGGAGYQTSSPRNDRTSMSNPRTRASADILDRTAQPYGGIPAGEPPNRGAVPLGGNATSDSDRTRARSIGGGRSVDLNRTAQNLPPQMHKGTTTTSGSSAGPNSYTTTTTTTTTTGLRSSSRQGTGRSQDLGHKYTSSDVPPQIPATDFSNSQGSHQAPPSNLPIANEFSSSTWSQHSAPSSRAIEPETTSQRGYGKEAAGSAYTNDMTSGSRQQFANNPPAARSTLSSDSPADDYHGYGNSNTGSAFASGTKTGSRRDYLNNDQSDPSYADDVPASAQHGYVNNVPTSTQHGYSNNAPHSSQLGYDGNANSTTRSAYANETQLRSAEPFPEAADYQSHTNTGLSSSQPPTIGHKRSMSIPRKSVGESSAPSVPPINSIKNQAMPVRDQQTAHTGGTGTSKWDVQSSYPVGQSIPLLSSEIRQGRQQIYNRPFVIEGSHEAPSLQGIVDLTNTVDTSTDIVYAPAIIHETVHTNVHHVRQEEYTREIHNYHIHDRTQPVIDVQVLPAKHLVRNGDGPNATYSEVPAALLPGRPESHFVIAETVSKIPGETVDRKAMGERHFTARGFGPKEGDYREYLNGTVPTTETTWIHPPRLAQAGRVAGETVPFTMDERAEAAAGGPGWVDNSGRVIVGGGLPEQ